MSFIVRTVFLCTALNVVAACSQRQSVQPVAEAAVHVSIGALVYDVTLKDDGVEVEGRPFALYANALGKQYPVKKVFLKGDAYKVESLAKILLKEGWTKGASLQPEEAAVFLHAPGEKKFHPVPAASGNTAVCKALNKACYEACLKEPDIS